MEEEALGCLHNLRSKNEDMIKRTKDVQNTQQPTKQPKCKYKVVQYSTLASPGRSAGGGGREGGSRGEGAGKSGSPGAFGCGAGMIFFIK